MKLERINQLCARMIRDNQHRLNIEGIIIRIGTIHPARITE